MTRRFMDKEFLTTGQAAQLCGVCLRTFQLWSQKGIIPVHLTPGGHRRILRSSLIEAGLLINKPEYDGPVLGAMIPAFEISYQGRWTMSPTGEIRILSSEVDREKSGIDHLGYRQQVSVRGSEMWLMLTSTYQSGRVRLDVTYFGPAPEEGSNPVRADPKFLSIGIRLDTGAPT